MVTPLRLKFTKIIGITNAKKYDVSRRNFHLRVRVRARVQNRTSGLCETSEEAS